VVCNGDCIFDRVEAFLITFDTPPLEWESMFLSLDTSEHGIPSMRFYASLIRDPLSSEEAPMDSKPLKNVALTHSSNSEVVFEDYLFYATLQREEYDGGKINSETTEVTEKPQELPPLSPDEQERMGATRALRITSWISVFFLLTTDMTGAIFVPYGISQVGWVPGAIFFTLRCVCSLLVASSLRRLFIILFLVCILSTYTGILLWSLFLRLDSLRYPLKTYGDVAERIFGRFARYICNFLQSIQLLITVYIPTATSNVMADLISHLQVGGSCLILGQGLSQISRGRVSVSKADDEL
jgi:hypothetical protein